MSVSAFPYGVFQGSLEATNTVTIGRYCPKTCVLHGFSLFSGGGFGSISPDDWFGYVTRDCMDTGTQFTFAVNNTGSALGSDWFTTLQVEDPASSFVTLNSSDASYSNNPGVSDSWTWSATYWTGDWNDSDYLANRDVIMTK